MRGATVDELFFGIKTLKGRPKVSVTYFIGVGDIFSIYLLKKSSFSYEGRIAGFCR